MNIDDDAFRRARTTDPQTSKDAARAVGGMADEHFRIIFAVIATGGDWTADEIATRCPLDRHQIGRRLGEMEREGMVRVTANQRPTPKGRMARCYEAVPPATNHP
jgi:predicted transcriptional regulator